MHLHGFCKVVTSAEKEGPRRNKMHLLGFL